MAASATLAQSSAPVREGLRAVLTADSAQAHKARPSDPPALLPPVWQLAARFLRAEPLAETARNPVFAAPRGAFNPRAPPFPAA